MNHDEELAAYLKRRDKALTELDIDFAREMIRASGREITNDTDDFWLTVLHQARYEATTVPKQLRHISRAWLEERNRTRMFGQEWPLNGDLPQ